jgi:hypothetical protein
VKVLVKFSLSTLLYAFGVMFTYVREPHEEIYKKYLGKDYKIQYDEKYSSIISNHIGWAVNFFLINLFIILKDTFSILARLAPGFISKSELKSVPVVGLIGEALDSIFFTREDQDNRTLAVIKLKLKMIIFINYLYS